MSFTVSYYEFDLMFVSVDCCNKSSQHLFQVAYILSLSSEVLVKAPVSALREIKREGVVESQI